MQPYGDFVMKLINMKELAEMMGLRYQTVQTYAKRNQWDRIPPPIKLGRSLRWDVDGIVIPWLRERQVRFEGETKTEIVRKRNLSQAQH